MQELTVRKEGRKTKKKIFQPGLPARKFCIHIDILALGSDSTSNEERWSVMSAQTVEGNDPRPNQVEMR